MFIFGFAVIFLALPLPHSIVPCIFISSQQKRITANVILAFKLNSGLSKNPPAKGERGVSDSGKKQARFCIWLFFALFRPRCSFGRGEKKQRAKKNRKINFLTLWRWRLWRFLKKYRFCYDALSEWIIPHIGRRICEHYFPPHLPTHSNHPSLFYKFEYTARFFSRIFNFHPHRHLSLMATLSLGSFVHIRRDFLYSSFCCMWRELKKCHILWLCWYRIGKKCIRKKNRHHLKRRWKKLVEDIWANLLILYRISSGERRKKSPSSTSLRRSSKKCKLNIHTSVHRMMYRREGSEI